MTQLLDDLRAARPVAPADLRERVRLLTAEEPAPRRQLPWRRIALVAAPAALAAAAVAGVVVGLSSHGTSRPQPLVERGAPVGVAGAQPLRKNLPPPVALQPSPIRLQDYRAALRLVVPDANAVSDRTKRAVRIAQQLGGIVTRVDVRTSGRNGSALIVMRIPIQHVTQAVSELGALGRIVGQHVAIVDVQRRIDTLRERVRASTGKAKEAAQRQLDRELRKARLSTVAVSLQTPPPALPKPHHRSTAGRILHAEGRIALYAGLIGGPLLALAVALWLAVRGLRRLSERRLLGRA